MKNINMDTEEPPASTSKCINKTEIEAEAEKKEESELANLATAEEYLEEKKIDLLEYERQMFIDVIHSDGLVVCAKGITIDRVLINFLKVYSDAANLILVINSSDWEEKFYKSQLEQKYVHEVAALAAERERVYLDGGVQFISTRILVVDLLKKRIPIELITGIVVLRAHTIIESCQEAFALHLYRQTNKTGFIKGFSSSAEAFTIGYSHVERTMRNLFVKELFIWPRFHATIQSSLKPYESQTIELHVPMTNKQLLIQTHILDIMNFLVKELKRINRTVDMEEITVENCVTKKFHKILQAQLDCIWHQLNSHTKLIVSDLKVLRNLMISTIYSDSVTAYSLMKRYRTTEYAHSNSGWILLDAADNMFKIAKERVYNEKDEFCPEDSPKWKALSEILRVEVPNDLKRAERKSLETVKVLILCQDSRTCYQLNEYLTQGGERYLLYTAMRNGILINKLADNYKNIKENMESLHTNNVPVEKEESHFKIPKAPTLKTEENATKKEDEESKILLGKSGENEEQAVDELKSVLATDDDSECNLFKNSYFLTPSQTDFESFVEEHNESSLDVSLMETGNFEAFPELENFDITSAIMLKNQPIVCIQTFKSDKDGLMSLDRTLNEMSPHYIIMYHLNVPAIRQLEVFEARRKRKLSERMKIFFLIHARTVEEQSYLTSLRREKQAFEHLIDTKSKMIIPEYQDGKTDEAFILLKVHTDDETEINTRQAGGQVKTDTVTPKIIVDMREFRSDLPCLIHRRGIEVIPVTITIGDYILTPEICVERKSISDLIGSLNSGRLYNQCIQMQRYYPKPILLIEFDQNKPFHLQGKYMLSSDSVSSNADIVQKLQLLTLHFPKLRLIWSPSPYATAQLFEELKQAKEEPDPVAAAASGSNEGANEMNKFNPNIFDFMIRLPGINSKNIVQIMRNGKSLKELLTKTEAELATILDSTANAKLLYDIIHKCHKPIVNEQPVKPFASKYQRGKGRKF